MKKLLFCTAAAVFLSACGTSGTDGGSGGSADAPKDEDKLSVPVEGMEEAKGFITDIDEDRVLVNDIYYTIDDETHFVSIGDGAERELELSDLEKGMRADVYHSGMIAKSFPGQGHASVFVVPKDDLSQRQTEAFQAFLEKEGSDFVLLGKPELGKDLIKFDYTIVESNETYTVELDIESHEYTKEPKSE
ncbi:hypothetical protein ACFFIY_10545 [Bhargavaea ullalensis]|uniref:DUF4352 domain-containing protein n=1 Tax=Bhargavaea ullalensis TaxID=1265685 RepID=A0ABV2G981_9BACL